MRKLLLVNLTVLLFIALAFNGGLAQDLGFKGVGGRVSFVDPEGAGGTIGFGGHVHLGEIIPNLVLHPSLEYWSKSSVSVFTLNGDLRYYVPTEGNINFFAGGGVALTFGDPNTELGLDLLGGADFPVSENLVATAKIKYLISDFNVLKITGGVTYLLGK